MDMSLCVCVFLCSPNSQPVESQSQHGDEFDFLSEKKRRVFTLVNKTPTLTIMIHCFASRRCGFPSAPAGESRHTLRLLSRHRSGNPSVPGG